MLRICVFNNERKLDHIDSFEKYDDKILDNYEGLIHSIYWSNYICWESEEDLPYFNFRPSENEIVYSKIKKYKEPKPVKVKEPKIKKVKEHKTGKPGRPRIYTEEEYRQRYNARMKERYHKLHPEAKHRAAKKYYSRAEYREANRAKTLERYRKTHPPKYKKKIICVETGQEYEDRKSAAACLGVEKYMIDLSLKKNRAIDGLHYKYKEKDSD